MSRWTAGSLNLRPMKRLIEKIGVLRVGDRPAAGPTGRPAARRWDDRDHRRRQPLAFRVGDDGRLAAFDGGHHRVRRPEVDTDRPCHVRAAPRRFAGVDSPVAMIRHSFVMQSVRNRRVCRLSPGRLSPPPAARRSAHADSLPVDVRHDIAAAPASTSTASWSVGLNGSPAASIGVAPARSSTCRTFLLDNRTPLHAGAGFVPFRRWARPSCKSSSTGNRSSDEARVGLLAHCVRSCSARRRRLA